MSDFNDKKLEKELKSFPKYKMDEDTIESMHAELMKTAEKYDQKDKRRMFMRRIAVGVTTVAAVVIVAFIALSYTGNDIADEAGDGPIEQEEGADNNAQPNAADDDEQAGEEREDEMTEDHDEAEEEAEEVPESDQDPDRVVTEKSEVIIEQLAEENYDEIAEFVHEDQGLLFSPYVNVSEDDLVFDKEEVANFNTDDTVYEWGVQDGSGHPIELTPLEYHDEHIYLNDYRFPDEVLFDEYQARGNMINNIDEFFPDAHTVEYFHAGEDDQEEAAMDYSSVNLVFEQNEQEEWKLVAIVTDRWTI
ncbi:hypothetical protein [Alkalibacillus aidingensis]|uniref:hypothetical protein n=1 Tax=Alkalibacillus aidingensis TaxID=2747607 RepID=UPI001661031D|nr:hypothetical protein [Alkalibacillus aidingensis]